MSRYLSFTFFLLFILVGCSSKESDEPSEIIEFDTEQDAAGNLLILNQLDESIYIYLSGDETPLKEIGPSTDFMVNVPNPEGTSKVLKIWKTADVLDPTSPDEENLYRKWEVVLPNSTADADRITWIIKSGESGVFVGELLFNYPSIDETGAAVLYSVDVFINNKTGSKITALGPGMQGKKVGLEYGYYLFYYLYWYSDPNSTTGREDIAWVEVDSSGISISTLINASNSSRIIDVPAFIGSNIGREGYINIINQRNSDLQIYVNGSTLIESIAITSLPPTGLSILEGNGGSFNFLIPEDTYQFVAKSMGTGSTVETIENIYVMELYDMVWKISDELTYSNISITNQSGESITIHDTQSNSYQGFYLTDGESNTYTVCDTVQSLIAISVIGDREAYLSDITNSWTITQLQPSFFLGIDDFNILDGSTINTSDITLSWTIGSENQNVSFQLLNAEYEPYADLTVLGQSITSFNYQYLDESKAGENYTFRINSTSLDSAEYGWQELSFAVDAIDSNGARIFPRQKQLDYDESTSGYNSHAFDIMLEDADSLASIYIELEYDKDIFSIDPNAVSNGSLFDGCSSGLIIVNDDSDETGVLQLSISFIGDDCELAAGSGQLVSVMLDPIGGSQGDESFISINNNSSFRDKDNNEIDISNISAESPHNSKIIFP